MIGLRGKFLGKGRLRPYKKGDGRLDWKHRQMQEAPTMVKGTNRRVVVVKSPDPRIFEEAIFIIRDDLFHRGNSADKVLLEAKLAANAYLRKTTGVRRKGWFSRLPAGLYAAAGAAATAIAWLAFRFVGV